MQTQTKFIKTEANFKTKFHVIILNIHNKNLSNEKSFNTKVLGVPMYQWVQKACGNIPFTIIETDENKDVFSLVEPFLLLNENVMVLYGSTPLLTNQTIVNIFDLVKLRNIKVAKLVKGYVFCKDANVKSPMVDVLINEEDFFIVSNLKTLQKATQILLNRVVSYHLKNDVNIINPSSCYIDATVEIGQGVIIYPNNTLKGNTIISDNVILKEGNVVENSVILKDCCISNSSIVNSIINDNVFIMPYCNITNNSFVGSFSTIESYVSLNNAKVGEHVKIKSHNSIGDNNG